MTLKRFDENVLEVLVETYKQVCLQISEDVSICQYLVQKGLAKYDSPSETILLTKKEEKLCQKLVQTVKGELDL